MGGCSSHLRPRLPLSRQPSIVHRLTINAFRMCHRSSRGLIEETSLLRPFLVAVRSPLPLRIVSVFLFERPFLLERVAGIRNGGKRKETFTDQAALVLQDPLLGRSAAALLHHFQTKGEAFPDQARHRHYVGLRRPEHSYA